MGEFVEQPRAVGTQETFVTIVDGITVLILILLSSTCPRSISERGERKNRTVNYLKSSRTWALVVTWVTIIVKAL